MLDGRIAVCISQFGQQPSCLAHAPNRPPRDNLNDLIDLEAMVSTPQDIGYCYFESREIWSLTVDLPIKRLLRLVIRPRTFNGQHCCGRSTEHVPSSYAVKFGLASTGKVTQLPIPSYLCPNPVLCKPWKSN